MSELKEQNNKWPRWFKALASNAIIELHQDHSKSLWYGIDGQASHDAVYDTPAEAIKFGCTEITAAEATDILRKRGDETWWSDSVKQALPCNGAEETNAPINPNITCPREMEKEAAMKQSATINPWHPIDDLRELPEDVTAKVELFNDDESKIEISDSGHLQVTRERSQKYYTHWRLHIPPPEKVVDEVEECRKAWFADNNSGGTITEIIAFALNWAKERGKK